MDVASGIAEIRSIQTTLQALTALSLTSYRFPGSAIITDDLSCDFIIAGAGSAGSVVATRLSENPDFVVCLFEAGGDPPFESLIPGLVGYMPLSSVDWKMVSVDDDHADQNLQNERVDLSCGNMLGGTSSLDHLINIRGIPYDFSRWAVKVNNTSWNYEGLLPYFIKTEMLEDEEILNSVYGQYHGTDGYLRMKREPNEINVPVLNAFAELGYDLPIDINNPEVNFGYTEAIYTMYDGIRQNAATTYLSSLKNRSNVHIFKNTKVIKVLFDSNNAATGVQVELSDGTTPTLNANKEVILSAGAIHTPQLLMLSGIGDKSHLESFDIPVISDLSVGKNLQDHAIAVIVYKMLTTNATTPVTNPHEYPLPSVVGLAALNESQGYPDYITFSLTFPHDSSNIIQFGSNIMKYKDDIVQAFYDAGKGRDTLLVGVTALRPESRGYVLLKSSDHSDDPLVYLQKYSDESDLVNMGKYLAHFSKVEKTSYFTSVGAELVNLDLPECADYTIGSEEYWQCYSLSMSVSIWNYCGTCSMGLVVDERLNVNGVSRLRVVDGSVMPNLPSGKINAAVYAIAEKASDIIKEDWNTSS